ncbi:RagB/SusD family nutrient uptake outer membrane protein [Salinibacter ruber]|uniref:RagB/SusD family nutrient uptake outer membrane protein n=1 Tax=Salinibacter ruber TaxID=146919 RepID=UPI003C6E8F2B
MRSLATILFTTAFLLSISGCDSVVEDTAPSQSVSQEVALSNPDAIRGVRASMFDRMHDEQTSTDWLLGPAAYGDNTFARSGQQRHRELNENDIRSGIGTGAYDEIYSLINDANILVSGIEEGAFPNSAEADKLEAEGLFMRALAMHHATRIFGYDPDGQGGVVDPNSGRGQGFELGIQIKTTPTLDLENAEDTPRSTVPEVYDQIISDLQGAITIYQNLPGDVKEASPFFPSEAAAQALLARVKLYQRDWSAADTRAQNALDRAASTFGSGLAAPDSGSVRSIFDERNGNPEAIFTIKTDPQAGESPGANDALSAYTSIFFGAQLPTQSLIDLYEPGDARLAGWYDPCFDEDAGEVFSGCSEINDNGFELKKWASERNPSQFADNHPHLRVAEMVLIQAEARLNEEGVSEAIDRLNDLREARGASTLNESNFDRSSALQEILDERRRELVAEGHRYFDQKRLGRDITKVRGIDDIQFRDRAILDDFPEEELLTDDSLQSNPGY